MGSDLVRGAVLFRGEGCQTFATDVDDLAILEFEDPACCRAADTLAKVLKRHVVITSYVEPHGERSLVVRRLEPIPLTVEAVSRAGEVTVRFVDGNGGGLFKEDVLHVPGVRKARLDMMEDITQHVARVVRAHLGAAEELRIRTTFGIASGGGCVLDVVNPSACRFGTTDYETLCGLLGGQVI